MTTLLQPQIIGPQIIRNFGLSITNGQTDYLMNCVGSISSLFQTFEAIRTYVFEFLKKGRKYRLKIIMVNMEHCTGEAEGEKPQRKTVKREKNGKNHRKQSANRNLRTSEK